MKVPKGPKFLPPYQRKLIDYGDKIVVYFDPTVQYLILVQSGKTFDCKYGHFMHANFVGKEFGTKVSTIHAGLVELEYEFCLRAET